MCLAIPVRIEAIEDSSNALACIDGLRKSINISLVPDVQIGDYVILHVGFALKKLNREEAEKTLAMFAEIEQLGQQNSTSTAIQPPGAEL